MTSGKSIEGLRSPAGAARDNSSSPSGGAPGGGVVKKPWGWENRFAVTDKYLGKVIHLDRGEMLSLQYHREKDETLLVVKGAMDLQLEDARYRFCLGVQWHPEFHIDPGDRRIFDALIAACRA